MNTSTPSNSYLVITALGQDHTHILANLTNTLALLGGNILNSKMTSLGNELGIMLLIEGSWGAIAKIEANLPSIEQKLDIVINVRRTTPQQSKKKTMPYLLHTVAIDREGILNDLTQFLLAQNIHIHDINGYTYMTNTGVRMADTTINIHVAATAHLPNLREKLMIYCDELNLDASLEPIRD